MAEVLFHIEHPTARARYIIGHVLGGLLGWKVREEPDPEACRRSGKPFLNYGHKPIEGGFQVHPQGLLGRATGSGNTGNAHTWGAAPPMPYPTPRKDPLFDPFAAAFWMLTRQEERDMGRDTHGRSLTSELHAARHGFLQRPVVDEWALAFAAQWRSENDRVPEPKRSYRQLVTLDMDNGFKYLGREAWRGMGSAARDLLNGRLRELVDRSAVLLGIARDPYDIDDLLQGLCGDQEAACMVSILAAPRGRYDHAVAVENPRMRERIRKLSGWARIAVHPSYRSSDPPGLIEGEKLLLEQVLGGEVTRSRQHFLRFRDPDTFRELIRLGVREEHSMGLHDAIGFRAGTCTPYPFFDVEREEITELIIHPFAVMDSALCYQMGLQPSEAIRKTQEVIEAVKQVQGTFISVWHERFLSDHGPERGWRRVAEEVIRLARS